MREQRQIRFLVDAVELSAIREEEDKEEEIKEEDEMSRSFPSCGSSSSSKFRNVRIINVLPNESFSGTNKDPSSHSLNRSFNPRRSSYGMLLDSASLMPERASRQSSLRANKPIEQTRAKAQERRSLSAHRVA